MYTAGYDHPARPVPPGAYPVATMLSRSHTREKSISTPSTKSEPRRSRATMPYSPLKLVPPPIFPPTTRMSSPPVVRTSPCTGTSGRSRMTSRSSAK